jgi:hypothetical protein
VKKAMLWLYLNQLIKQPMKKIFTTLMILACGTFAFGQMQVDGKPYQLTVDHPIPMPEAVGIALPALNMKEVRSIDDANVKNGVLELFSRWHHVNLNTDNSGSWFTMPNGDRMWRLKITAEDAMAIHLTYNKFYLPEGSIMYIYNEDYSDVIGGYTSANNKKTGVFGTGNVTGETCIIEYYQPKTVTGAATIEIDRVGHAYRWIAKASNEEKADPCEVDVACSPESDDWKSQVKGVVRLLINSGGGGGFCSGSVINNTSLDCTPYVLTALHCGVSGSAADFNSSIVYFNYQRPSCGSGSPSASQSMTGFTRRADSNDGGGNSGPDYLLLEMNSTIPGGYNVFYNGWSNSTSAAASGVSIHHPAGDEKKISTFTTSLVNSGWVTSGTHWRVIWRATPNGHGVTEGGSSGSPIFNQNGQIVGQLTGGGSFCTQVPNPSADFYGRMSINWNSGPKNPGDALKDWLDPTSTGVTSMDGTYVPCAIATYDNSAVDAVNAPTGIYCDLDISPEIVMTNNGLDNITTATIEWDIDGGATQTFNWTGTLCPNDDETITLTTMTPAAGSHTFNVTITVTNGGADGDASDNTSSSSFTTTDPLTSSLSGFNPSCGSADGSITSTIGGGTPTFDYLWNVGGTSSGLTALGIGEYILTTTDANGCEIMDTVSLINVGAPVVSGTFTSESCAGVCDGTLDATSTGGTGAVTYNWDGGIGSGAIQSSICPGTYTVTATDASGCQSVSTVTISNGPSYPVANFSASTTTTIVGSSVSFSQLSTGGATSYFWDFGDGTTSTSTFPPTHSWNPAGTYVVWLYASKGACIDSMSITITVGPNSVDELFSNIDVNLFPNPTEGLLNITIAGNAELDFDMEVYGVDGKLLDSKKVMKGVSTIELNLSDYAQGLYLITFRSGDQKMVKRITKF